MSRNQKGFTLIELLIVIAVIAILAATVFVALDPAKRLKESRNAQRWSDVNAMIGAIKTDQVDNGGSYVAAITALTDANNYIIGTDAAACDAGCTAKVTQAACADLTALVTEGYLGSVPMDPSTGTAAKTDYYITKSATGIIEIGSCDPEASATINISR